MPIGISEEHEALRVAARRFLETHCPPSVPRAFLEAEADLRPPFWEQMAGLGWLGLHVAEEHGGQGAGLVELAVVLEELGRAVAPGPFLPTALAAALIEEAGDDKQRAAWLPGLVSGETIGAVAFSGRPVLGAALADVFVLPAEREADGWWVATRDDVTVEPLPSFDPTRRVAAVTVTGKLSDDHRLGGLESDRVRELAAVMLAAEAAGGAGWCLDTASAYAKVREQFGRPIGQFQAVKHRCSDMLVALEQARGAAWDAALAADDPDQSPLAASVAGALAPDAFFKCAKDCVQILGGIGFTWEHDAHLYLKRAGAILSLLGTPRPWRSRTASLALSGARRHLDVDLPEEADEHRATVRAFLDAIRGLDERAQRERMVDEGYVTPHWPSPWGRAAGAVEQVVIDQEFRAARIWRPNLAVGAWAAPTIIAHGTVEQQERWVRPTLLGDMTWCQMFSEPGAGSDLASLSTKASRTDGGWLLSGQKVWTSLAQRADWAICLARTNPDAPKHLGITYFLVDMHAEGIDVRPLRELTGAAMFNEVFLSDVFVPDECVVGEVDEGWPLARTTLANERVAMSTGSSFGGGVEAVLKLVASRDLGGDEVLLDQLGALLAEAQSLALLGFRTTLRALSGAEPGPESSVRKLLGVEHDQRVSELALALLGQEAAVDDGDAAVWAHSFLAGRCLTIAGGTSEVQRNVIAERLLGLPRDP